MAADKNMLLRALVLAATRQKTESKTPTQVLEDIITGRFTTDFSDGRTVISTAEAGGSTTFALADNLSPADVVALAMEAIGILKSFADPDEPTDAELFPRRIKRLKVSFAKAVAS